MVGVATITFWLTPNSISSGSFSKAALKNTSPGRKSTTNSGVKSNCSKYAFRPSAAMWFRTCRAWSLNLAARVSSSGASIASRYASSGAFESTTMFLPPGSCTTMSGRSRPSSPVGRLLLEEVAMFEHPGHLDHAAQLDFAPAAAGLRAAERLDQVGRLAAQLLLRLRERADLLRSGRCRPRSAPSRSPATWRPPCPATP